MGAPFIEAVTSLGSFHTCCDSRESKCNDSTGAITNTQD